MFIRVKSKGFPVIVPVDNIALVAEQKDNNNAKIYFKNSFTFKEGASIFNLNVDCSVEEVMDMLVIVGGKNVR